MTSNKDIDKILDKVYEKLPPYMGHNGLVDDEEFNNYERHELREAIMNLITTHTERALMAELEQLEAKSDCLEDGCGLDASLLVDNLLRRIRELNDPQKGTNHV